ncbi:MAG: hypothetical protein V9G24_16460 [Rhodoblastus sp.]
MISSHLLGGRWYAVAGAIILVIGIGLGFKWAYDNGYLRISPAWHCISGVLLGLALILGGEFLRKRINAWAAFGALRRRPRHGLHLRLRRLPALQPAPPQPRLRRPRLRGGFGRRGRVAVPPFRRRRRSLFFAGYIVPLLFADIDGHPAVLPCYLLMLMAIGLVLAGWLGGTFVFLRTLAWFGTVILGSVWALRQNAPTAWYSLGFVAATYGSFQGELVWSALRRGLISSRAPAPGLVLVGRGPLVRVAPADVERLHHGLVGRARPRSCCARSRSRSGWPPPPPWSSAPLAGHMLAGNLTILREVCALRRGQMA